MRAPVIRQVHGNSTFQGMTAGFAGEQAVFFYFSRDMGSKKHKWGRVGRGFLSHGPSFEGIAVRPSPTMRREGIASSQLLLFIFPSRRFLFIKGEAHYSHQRPE